MLFLPVNAKRVGDVYYKPESDRKYQILLTKRPFLLFCPAPPIKTDSSRAFSHWGSLLIPDSNPVSRGAGLTLCKLERTRETGTQTPTQSHGAAFRLDDICYVRHLLASYITSRLLRETG